MRIVVAVIVLFSSFVVESIREENGTDDLAKFPSGTIRVYNIIVEHAHEFAPSVRHRYEVALISVRFEDELWVERNDDRGESRSYRGDSDTILEGTTRLVCGLDIFESHDTLVLTAAEEEERPFFPTHLVPLSRAKIHPAIAIAAARCQHFGHCRNISTSNRSTVDRRVPGTDVQYLLMVGADEYLKGGTFDAESDSRAVSRHVVSNLSACELRFLSENKQTILLPKTLVLGSERGPNHIVGASPLRLVETSETCESPKSQRTSPPLEISRSVAETVADYFDRAILRRTSKGACVSVRASNGSNDSVHEESSAETNVRTQSNEKTPDDYLKHLNTRLLETESKTSATFSFLIKPLEEVLPVKVIGQTLGNLIVGGIMNNHLEHGTAEYILFMLVTDIEKMVTEGMTTNMRETIVDSLAETLSDSVSEALTLEMQRRVSSSLTSSLSTVMSRSVDRGVVERLSPKAGKIVGAHLERVLQHNLLRVLIRSLSHTIVPSLVQTVSHSPLQDYYCYYCYHHGVYCQYCHYAPLQLYYAQYYATYYASYYADYFSDYAVRVGSSKYLQDEYVATEERERHGMYF
eukprot:g3566.t1